MVVGPGEIAERRLLAVVGALVSDEPVIALHGPRSVGKSTLLRAFAAARGVAVVDLDDPLVLEAVVANPMLAVEGPAPVCLDEYQKAPELLDALKTRLNREGTRAGTAVLTGSTRHDAIPRSAQALTGRLHTLTILPLSQGEIQGNREDLLECLIADAAGAVAAHPTSDTARTEYVRRVCTGGFPLAVRRRGAARSRWFDDYVRLSVERDSVDLARVRQRRVLNDLLDRLAGQTAQILNVAAASRDLSAERKTIDGYVRLLEDLFLIQLLPAWGKTLRARAGKLPKLHLVDSGLAGRLLRCSESKLATLEPAAMTDFGHLLETFVHGELRKQASWLDEPVAFGHWRADDHEVDMVVELDDGRIVGFEVKANQRILGKDFAGMRTLRNILGDRFVAGVAFSTGTRSYTYEDRLHVLPVDRLWRPVLA